MMIFYNRSYKKIIDEIQEKLKQNITTSSKDIETIEINEQLKNDTMKYIINNSLSKDTFNSLDEKLTTKKNI